MTAAPRVTPGEKGPHLDQFLTFRLSRVQAKLNVQAARLLSEKAGLTLSQWRIIALIGSQETGLASELTRRSAMDKGLFSRKLKSLTEAGLVESRPHEADHRAQVLSLTAAGRRKYEETLPHMQARQAGLQAELTETERAVFFAVLDKLDLAAERTDFGT